MTLRDFMSFRLLKLLFILSGATMLSACSSLPETLKSDNPQVITDYAQWQSQVDASNEVRLGGLVANVTNLEDKTRVEVVNLPIDSSGKPDITQEPQGRFVAYIQGFADPVTLSTGRLISLLGNAQASEQGKVGDYLYDFPVMQVKGYHLWRIEERVIIHDFDSYLYPCHGLYCRESRYGPRQGTVIQEVR